MTKDFTRIGYMDSCYDKTMKCLTADVLEELTASEQVRETMELIQAEPDEEKKAQLKKRLPVVLYACQMTQDGTRPTAENHLGVPSGFCLHDWDDIPVAPGQLYMEQIAGREAELRIVLAHITPRGKGLRLVTVLNDGEQIVQCQERLAAQFGMQQYADRKIKDITRLSYLPSQDYILYVNPEGLFQRPQMAITAPLQAVGEPQRQTPSNDREEQSTAVSMAPKIADTLTYDGLKYSTIVEALLQRLATQGEPREGERNDDLFNLARELRHICDYNFQMVYMLVAPYFSTLPDAEIRRTIGSAIATNGRTITPTMRGVLSELKNEAVSLTDEASNAQLPKLPKVSPVEEMILSHYPKHLRSQAFMASLPIWGVYGTHIRFDYLDGRENSLSFMTSVVGKSGSGKAFAAHLFDQMTPRFREEDMLERQKADAYLAMCNKVADSSEKPEDPRPRVRIYGDDITTCQMLDYLDNLNGEHGLQFTEEVARLQKAKRTIWSDNDDLYCKAFDNAVGGKESKSKQTRNIRIPIYLNTLFCGTPGAMHKFYNNPEGGLNNRVIFAFMPKVRVKGFPHYSKFTEEEKALFDETTERLWQAGQDGVKVQLPWLEKVILSIKAKWDKEDDENPDDVWYDLGKRSLVVAMRTGVLEWFLRGCPTDEKQIREISRLVRWMSDAMRQCVYSFSGQDYEDINETDNQYQQKQSHMTKNKKLFSLLPGEFSAKDLITLRIQNGGNSNVSMVICRWTADGLIRKTPDGRYRKVTQAAA